MHSKLHSKPSKSSTQRWVALPLCGLLMALWVSAALAAPVAQETARRVAENTLRRHVALYGDWNGGTAPEVGPGEPIVFSDSRVAYNFSVQPSGHVLVAVDDLISPVLLYSTRSRFDASRADRPQSIESWIVPEVSRHVRRVRERAASDAQARAAAATTADSRIARAWRFYGGESVDTAVRSASMEGQRADLTRSAALSVGPLLTTAWGQFSPYNLMTPNDGCDSGHALTGCVATAWAQLMRYWRWPIVGMGSHSYPWPDPDGEDSLSVVFDAPYDWDNMPNVLVEESTYDQKIAVSMLMYHVGVAAEMEYGCESSASGAWADDVLDTYFRYQSGMTYYGAAELAALTSSERFVLLKNELDADPPRPAILSIFDPIEGTEFADGHEVVVDGYQITDTVDFVHIKFGWADGSVDESGYFDGWYNIAANFTTGSYTWDALSHHFVVGIQPDNHPPVVIVGDDQSVNEATTVQLSGSATDPEGVGATYRWTQASGQPVVLSDATSLTPTFTAPNVHAPTDLVFQFRADDLNRAWAAATVTVTIANSDGSSAVSGSGGGGGGGGCFIALMGDDQFTLNRH